MRTSSEALWQVIWPLLCVVGALALLAMLVYYIRSWWVENDGPAASEHELLAEYRELNRRGELSDEEYRIIIGRIASRLGVAGHPADGTLPPPSEKLEKA